ncbi:MAG: tautomerase family protein [Chitinophagales bacterium]
MPVITYDGGKLNKEQKAELDKVFSETGARAINIPLESFHVYIKEHDRENIARGGVLLADKIHK